jgi:hypothetical protein
MGYEVFSFVLGVAVVGLLWERHKLVKELNHAKTLAAMMFADKLGIKVGGKEVKIEMVSDEEMDEIIKKEREV